MKTPMYNRDTGADSEKITVDFTGVPDEHELCRQWPQGAEPKLSIACLAYNHRQFIEQTLRGFFIQKTNFPFHIVCYDDCSSDGTRRILRGYQQRFPNIIKLVFPEENQHSQGRRPYTDYLVPELSGEYVTCCEGDDYWTDPMKLQKQVDFLDRNPEYVLTTHDIRCIDENGNTLVEQYLPEYYKRDFSALELRLGWAGPVTQAILFRNVLKDYPPEYWKAELGDVFQASLLGAFGRSAYLPDVKPSIYRHHGGGIFSSLNEVGQWDRQADSFYWIYRYYQRIGRPLEARAFKLKLLEKHLRSIGWRECLDLALVKFFGVNLKERIDRLFRAGEGG